MLPDEGSSSPHLHSASCSLTVPKYHGEDSEEKSVFVQKGHGGKKRAEV